MLFLNLIMELSKAIQSRQSIRKFSDKKPDWKEIIECIDACRYAPMAGNNFSLKFVLVDDKERIQKLGECCQQSFVSTAHYIVVVCTIPERTTLAYEEFAEKFLRQQAGAAIQNFLLEVTSKDLATCWVGYFVEELVKSELKIPANAKVEALFPIGYEYSKTKPKKKINIDNILYFNKYGEKQMKKIPKMDV